VGLFLALLLVVIFFRRRESYTDGDFTEIINILADSGFSKDEQQSYIVAFKKYLDSDRSFDAGMKSFGELSKVVIKKLQSLDNNTKQKFDKIATDLIKSSVLIDVKDIVVRPGEPFSQNFVEMVPYEISYKYNLKMEPRENFKGTFILKLENDKGTTNVVVNEKELQSIVGSEISVQDTFTGSNTSKTTISLSAKVESGSLHIKSYRVEARGPVKGAQSKSSSEPVTTTRPPTTSSSQKATMSVITSPGTYTCRSTRSGFTCIRKAKAASRRPSPPRQTFAPTPLQTFAPTLKTPAKAATPLQTFAPTLKTPAKAATPLRTFAPTAAFF
jgi:hypothetical protein